MHWPTVFSGHGFSNHRARLYAARTDLRLIETSPCPLLLIKTTRPYSSLRMVAAVNPLHAHPQACSTRRFDTGDGAGGLECLVRKTSRDRLDHLQALLDRMQHASRVWRRLPDQMPTGDVICALVEAVAGEAAAPATTLSTPVTSVTASHPIPGADAITRRQCITKRRLAMTLCPCD